MISLLLVPPPLSSPVLIFLLFLTIIPPSRLPLSLCLPPSPSLGTSVGILKFSCSWRLIALPTNLLELARLKRKYHLCSIYP
ncbi:hypothetical protein A4X13_0g2965 [Tilletia indica]|uniref:Uncharacterized protein n=1 Tax=Tilletia indica TaxID=43049 RepID=A0A177T9I7_9BASI|nr:hypothetical protein A4X13_0g2965 [Tilletia indica]